MERPSQQHIAPPPSSLGGSVRDNPGPAHPQQPAVSGLRVGNVNKSIIADTVQNTQGVNFESTHAGTAGLGGVEQSILAQKVDIQGSITYKTRNIIYTTTTPTSESNPKDVFSRSPLRFNVKQDHYQQVTLKSPGSGRWLLKSEDFVDWKENDTLRKLWLVGDLGAGKTILASTVIHHLTHKYSSKNFACLYVYFDHEQQSLQTYEKLLAELLSQLIRVRGCVSSESENAYNKWAKAGIPPSPEDYVAMIKSEIETFTKVFIVVDALDECLDEDPDYTATEFVKALNQLPHKTHMLFTSRPLTTIHDLIGADKKLPVRTTVEDLTAYFRSRINSRPGLKKLVDKGIGKNPRFLQDAVDTIISRSQGMFLLAQLHVESLISKRTLEDLELGIQELPADLNTVYAKALKQIQDNQKWRRDLAVKVLNWLIYAERPLSLDELVHAIGVKEDDVHFHKDRLPPEQDITLACSGIVVVDPDSRTVSLTHQTAREYLQSSGMLGESQSYLATTCIVYMSFTDFNMVLQTKEERETRLKQYPFLKYAANHWGDHVDRGVKGPVRQKAWNFLNDAAKLQNAIRVMTDTPFHKESGVVGLHIAAYFGLTNLVQGAIKRRGGLPLNATTHSGETALHWAARHQQTKFLQLLVDSGADLNLVDNVRSRNQTSLHLAVMNRDVASVTVLLESKRCEVNLADAQGWTPLRWAAAYGHSPLVRLLLKHGARVDDKDKDGWTALRWAIQRGHMNVTKLLISNSADIKSPLDGDLDQRTLLQWAASEGDDALVRLLIKRGAPVDAVDESGQTALRWAVKYGKGISAWFLLQGGADINHQDKNGYTTLHAAIKSWRPGGASLLWMLLEYKSSTNVSANINAKSRHGFTPLHQAALNGFTQVIWLLLEKGADPMLKDSTGRTPLHCAAEAGHSAAAAFLLTSHPNTKIMRSVDTEGRTALHAAASGDYPQTVQALLEGGALPIIDVKDSEGYTALHRAVRNQYVDVVRCLVKGGADVNQTGRKGRTALHMAMYHGNVPVINALLEAETIDQTVKDGKGQTAWDVGKRRMGPRLKELDRQVHFED